MVTMAAAAPGCWEAAKAAIAAYTGLSPAAFFTAVAVAAALCVAVSGLFARPAPPPRRREAEVEERAFEPLPPPVQLGEVTEEELRAYDGSDPKKPLLMAIKGQIYDVTQSRMFYGPGGPYALFAGRDASRALAKMSFEPNDLTGDISGLGPFEVEALQEWEYKFMSKYVKVGTIKKTIPVSEGDAAGHAGTSERGIDASTIETNNVPEPEEDGPTSHAGAVEKPRETADVDVNTSNHEDAEEKPKGLPDVDVKNTSSHEDAVEKPKETPDADLKNTSSTEDEGEPKGTPGVDEKNKISPEDAVEKPKEATDVGGKNTSSHEDAGEPKETRDVDEKNTRSHQDAVEKPKETADVQVKNA